MEAWAGRLLFERRPNGVVLTEAGRALGQRVQSLLDEVIALGPHVREQRDQQQIVVRCQFSLAAKWLAPLIVEFRKQRPECSIVLRAEPAMSDPLSGRADMAIYYPRTEDSTGGVPLVGGRFVVAAAPALMRSLKKRSVDPATIADSPLIHFVPKDRGWHEPGWSTWFTQAGLPATVPAARLTASMMNVVIDMCVAGGGFALVHEPLALPEFRDGRLVVASSMALRAPHTYYLSVRDSSAVRPEVQALRQWLTGNAIL